MSEVFDYSGLYKSVEAKRQSAACFYRVDLHVHTIGSPASDYPRTHGKPGFVSQVPPDEFGLRDDPTEFGKRFLDSAKGKRLRIVAITDHNESDVAAQLSVLSDNETLVLPGIEISVQTSFLEDSTAHILAVFPSGTSSKEIDKVFPAGCGMPASGKRNLTSTTHTPVDQVINLIHTLQGVAIAAHANSNKGIRTVFRGQDRKYLEARAIQRFLKNKAGTDPLTEFEAKKLEHFEQILQKSPNDVQNAYLRFLADYEFDAIQIQDADEEGYYCGEHTEALGIPPFVCIVASDAHTLVDLGCDGHCTHIKLSDISLRGIKKAFNDPGARIRYDTTVHHRQTSRVLGISFEGGSFDGQVLGFSDNLTTLIGGRGTGKSAVIEALRHVFESPIAGLPDRLQADVKERLAFTLRESTVRVLFQDDSECVHVLKRRFGDSHTDVYDLAACRRFGTLRQAEL